MTDVTELSGFSNETWAKAAKILKRKSKLKELGQEIEDLLSSSVGELKLINFRSEFMVAFQYFTLEHLEDEDIDSDKWREYRRSGGLSNPIGCFPPYIVEASAQELMDEYFEDADEYFEKNGDDDFYEEFNESDKDFEYDCNIEEEQAKELAVIEEEEQKRIEFENSPEHQKFLAEKKERKEHEVKVQSERRNLQKMAFSKSNIEKDFITITDSITTTGISRTLVSVELFKIFCKQSVNEDDSKKNAKTLKSFANDFFEFLKQKTGEKYRLPTFSELKMLYEIDKTAFPLDSCELTESDECVFLETDGTLQTKPREGSGEYNFRICKNSSVKKIEKPKPHFDYIYEIDKQNDGVVLKGCKDENVKEFIVPSEIDGKKVVHIAKDAFNNLEQLESIKFEVLETKNISSFNLRNCYRLKQIQFGDSIRFKIR